MLNFIKAMLKAKVRLKHETVGIRIFNSVSTELGYSMSIQCSEHHYCSPRKLNGLNSYDTFEVAIFLENKFVYPSEIENFPRKKELDQHYEGTVFGYVPKDLVEDLYNYLNVKK
ncbi:hypothetical protein [Metaclostridioides mangenotii]|uniref:hypothetical protein n=1 Tax=Metaclostridioides mangenotii TaxID=1540 RepID=UPI0004647553|nr:hypothetical protein [Clostridioides mangenotii]